jgi:uncharacterized protein
MTDSVELAPPDPAAPEIRTKRPPRIWGFWGTVLWGLFVSAAMVVGQIAVPVWFVLRRHGSLIDMGDALHGAGGGMTIALSVIMGVPAVLAALWIAIRITRTSFASYLALRGSSWKNFLIGAVALAVLVMGWEMLSRATGRDGTPDFMFDVLKSARNDSALWLLVIAFAVAAPVTEELLARGFLYRGWSESVLGPYGAILLSSIVWTSVHLQYNWFFLGEVFSIGLLLGYLRYRFNSIWVTIFVHSLNNFAAVAVTFWLAGQS